MILVAGLTPAWQQILRIERLRLGGVNRAREGLVCASGKVLNAALALHHLGAPVRALAPLGGVPGEAIRREIEALGLPARWIPTAAPTRLCTTVLDGATTELVQNAPPLSAPERRAFGRAFVREARRAELVILTGSLPAGAPATTYRELLAHVRGRAILDARGPELLAALARRPYLVKPNREELARTLPGRRPIARLLGGGAAWVVVSGGAGPVTAASAEGAWSARPPRRPVVNPIGCGDCLAAGIAWGLLGGQAMPEALRTGMAAAADRLGQLRPGRLDPARVRRLASTIRITRSGTTC